MLVLLKYTVTCGSKKIPGV